MKKKKLVLSTNIPLLMGEEKSQPKMLKDCDFPFMKSRPKFSKDAIWERVTNNQFTDISVCSGILNLMKVAVVIPSWSDFVIKLYPDGEWEWYSPLQDFCIESHGSDGVGQFNGFKKGYINLKFINPWRYAGKNTMAFFLMQPWLHEETRFEVVEGMGVSKYSTELNINVFFKIPKKEKLVYIKEGEPLAYYIPYMSEIREVELINKDLGEFAGRNSFTNWAKYLVR